ncbi:E3 ubiquitin-protein ligase MARCH [Aspergillus ibericus CBS 121593]|uniref:RING finger domain protein n=1 Tax=Aspergillus ibericus CBS 121593 TaxID=1448316 RepID=A0A395GSI8_9EURO|nr:RING finger domain protein [Aspergillus ibericus CBS 121593]RAK97928.1 RING finger domain protein [Aspergillus ibericus CBS 121593]
MDLHNKPRWQWPSSSAASVSASDSDSDVRQRSEDIPQPADTHQSPPETSGEHYPPRTCRICLETVYPTFPPPSEHLPGFLQSKQRVIYKSSDPESGRLLRPCKCKGSSRYVHEGCLQLWRHADPGYGKRNYWHCPTCGFHYRLERLQWAHWISSPLTQLGLTLIVLMFTIFLLGFVADPIINLYVDPMDPILRSDLWDTRPVTSTLLEDKRTSWTEHFVKGLASLGFLSFVKAIFALSSWQGLTLRGTGMLGGGRNNGRNRVAWLVIVIGVGSFLWAVYKAVRTWSCRALEKAGERVMDVPLPDDEDEDDVVSSRKDD